MDLKKLPPSMLVLLGLGGPGMQACCLTPIPGERPGTSGVSTTGTSTTGISATSSPPQDTTAGEVSEVGPCLSLAEESTGTSSGGTTGTGTSSGGTGTGTSSGGTTSMGSDSGSSSGSGSGEGSTTFVPCLAPPGIAPDDTPDDVEAPTRSARVAASRREALEQVLDALPIDVAARLRKTIP